MGEERVTRACRDIRYSRVSSDQRDTSLVPERLVHYLRHLRLQSCRRRRWRRARQHRQERLPRRQRLSGLCRQEIQQLSFAQIIVQSHWCHVITSRRPRHHGQRQPPQPNRCLSHWSIRSHPCLHTQRSRPQSHQARPCPHRSNPKGCPSKGLAAAPLAARHAPLHVCLALLLVLRILISIPSLSQLLGSTLALEYMRAGSSFPWFTIHIVLTWPQNMSHPSAQRPLSSTSFSLASSWALPLPAQTSTYARTHPPSSSPLYHPTGYNRRHSWRDRHRCLWLYQLWSRPRD